MKCHQQKHHARTPPLPIEVRLDQVPFSHPRYLYEILGSSHHYRFHESRYFPTFLNQHQPYSQSFTLKCLQCDNQRSLSSHTTCHTFPSTTRVEAGGPLCQAPSSLLRFNIVNWTIGYSRPYPQNLNDFLYAIFRILNDSLLINLCECDLFVVNLLKV